MINIRHRFSLAKILFLTGFSLGTWHLALGTNVYADPQSSSFRLTDDFFSHGGGNASSANYQAAETTLGFSAQSTLRSANYSAEGKAGIEGTNKIPTIQSVSPGDYARFFTDEPASFTVTAVTPPPDTLQYQAKQDGVSKAGPQASGTLRWPLGPSAQGRHAVSLNAIDPDGTVSKQQATYVVRRPVK